MLYLNVLKLIYSQPIYIYYITNNKVNANLKVKTPALLTLLLKMLIKLIFMVLGNGFHSWWYWLMWLKGPVWSGYVKWMTQKLRTQFSNPVSSSLLPGKLTCIYAAPFRYLKSSLQHLSHSHTNLYTGGTNCSSQEVTYDALIRGFEITLLTLHSVDAHSTRWVMACRPVFPRHLGLF